MPHQCLNCGRIIERGSKEILKGCSDCGGKKFMFVDAPLPRQKREDLKRKADEVRDEMIRKADPQFLDLLREKGIGNLDGAQVEMDEELGEDWVRVQVGMDQEVEIEEGEPDSRLSVVSPSDERRSAKDLISQFDKDRKKGAPAEPDKRIPSKPKKKRKRPKVSVEGVPRKAPRRRPTVPEPVKKRDDKAVISIVEQGVYEIDVERLLDDDPIVIEKDGSYLLHLPSLFKEGREKAKKS